MDILFPIGRLVGGSVSKLKQRTEQDGKMLKFNRDGTPAMQLSFGVAIPKTQARWQDEVWGATVFGIGKAAFPQMHVSPAFAWKVIDGDSMIPNKNGKVPSTLAGHAGHWVIWFSQGWAPKLVTADGATELPAEKFVGGYYVQVYADVSGNGAVAPNTPGVYMNPVAVALAGEGEVIATEVDTTSLGFGGALPAGAKPVTAAAPAFAAPITPNASFMTPPPPPRQMTALAGGATFEQFIAQGWDEAAMRAAGYLV
jgi:hypothetical protein